MRENVGRKMDGGGSSQREAAKSSYPSPISLKNNNLRGEGGEGRAVRGW